MAWILDGFNSHRKSQAPLTLPPFRTVPQYNGFPGWLILTHSEDGTAQALFVDGKGRTEPVPLVMDERLCEDTVFRVVKLAKDMLLVYDVWVVNGSKVWDIHPFHKRQELIGQMLELFHQPDLTALVSLDKVPVGLLIRGYESYDEFPGTFGVYTEHLPAQE